MSTPHLPSSSRLVAASLVAVLLLSGCSDGGTAATDTAATDPAAPGGEPTAASPRSTAAATAPTGAAATATTRSGGATPEPAPPPVDPPSDAPQNLLELLDQGFTLSDEYVVETVVTDIDSATGGLAVMADGTMLQADFGYPGHPGNTIHRIAPDGTVSSLVTDDAMEALTMTTFGPDGTLYQASFGSDTVFAVDPVSGALTTVAEGIRGPTGIVAREDGSLVVASYNSNTVHLVTPDGAVSDWVRDPGFSGPNGLAEGPDGTLYVVNHRDGGLFSVAADGTVTQLVDFPFPTSHVAYLDGGLFVTSRGGYVVYRHDLATGQTAIIAGNGEPGDADGRGASSSFGRPNAITIGPDGALWINHGGDGTNSPVTIRRITHDPTGKAEQPPS